MKPLIFQIWTHGTSFQKATVIVRYTPHQVGSSYRRANLKLVIISHKGKHILITFLTQPDQSTSLEYIARKTISKQKSHLLPDGGYYVTSDPTKLSEVWTVPQIPLISQCAEGFPRNFGCPSLGKNRMSYVALQNASFLLESVCRRVVETRSTSF